MLFRKKNVDDELERIRTEYILLMQKTLCGTIYQDGSIFSGELAEYNHLHREYGADWPIHAHTMIGLKRTENLINLVKSVIGNSISGDLIETGVWRGGACILMQAVLAAYNVLDRNVWVADSFRGLPKPDITQYPADEGSIFHEYNELAVSVEDVRYNFERYGLLKDNVRFLEGWFKDTLPIAPISRLALIRLDGDMYESTMDALTALYPKLSVGGYVIVDDYHVVEACKEAVHDYLVREHVKVELIEIDGVGVYWKK